MNKLKTGKCSICLEDTMVRDITPIVIFKSTTGFHNTKGNICEDCYQKLIEDKHIESKDGISGMNLKH